ncbi:dihydroorotase [Desulfitispora alkaliphila]|uniref:dihydroorotase n=1 Tax=Desulfitispora alkaliphila TaxID=622674 RepID=UPI003D24EDF8
MNISIKGSKIFYNGKFQEGNLLVKDGTVETLQPKDYKISEKYKVIEVGDNLVVPGLVDMHVHLREPGFEAKETIATGTRSAAAGGFTSVACMPNTNPAIDNKGIVDTVINKAKREGVVRTYPVGAITIQRAGKKLVEMVDMKQGGAVAFSDDGNTLMNANLMRMALEYSKAIDVPIIAHCEEESMLSGGVMNEGHNSCILGLPGISNQVEDIIVARDLMLAEMTNAKLHIAHVSTKGAVELIRQAKVRGVKVTAEVAPHHLTLTDSSVIGYDTNTKVNPPLRTQEDIEALISGLKEGVIDCIATDHAPHTKDEKNVEYANAPFGMVGLETVLSIVATKLVEPGHLTWEEVIEKMSTKPCEVLNIPGGKLENGTNADITIIDPNHEWTINKDEFISKGKNTPFDGWKVKGKAIMTIVAGQIVMEKGKIIE